MQQLASPAKAQVYSLPSGDAGVAYTIRKMRPLIRQGIKSAKVRGQALTILNQYKVKAFDWMGQARAHYDWILRNITFTPDPRGIEGLQSADWTLDYRRGDCDDYTTLMCSLLGTIGMKCRMVTIAGDPRDPDQFSHIFPEVSVNGQWVTVDAARRRPQFGLSPTNYFRKRWWAADDEAWGDMQGLSGMRLGLNVTPNALPGAYRANSSPVLEAVQSQFVAGRQQRRARLLRKRAGLGYVSKGHYRRLGDWSDFTDNLPEILSTATTGAANIITAQRAAPQNLYPTTNASSRVPAGYSPLYSFGYPSTADGIGGISTSTLLIGGLLLGGLLLARRG
jgi:Transglutaminase-like superfamily